MDWAFFSKWTGAKNRKMTEIATFYSKKKCRQIDRSFDGKQWKDWNDSVKFENLEEMSKWTRLFQ